MQLRNKKTINATEVRRLHYIDFQTQLLQTLEESKNEKRDATDTFTQWVRRPGLFTETNIGVYPCYHLEVNWPFHNNTQPIKIMVQSIYPTVTEYIGLPGLEIYCNQELVLSLAISNDQKLLVTVHSIPNNLTISNLQDVITNINQLFCLPIVEFTQALATEMPIKKNIAYHFSKAELLQCMQTNADYNITTKIQRVILDHAKLSNQTFTFYLDWPDHLQNEHLLKANFSRNDVFESGYTWMEGKKDGYSWMLDEKAVLQQISTSEHKPLKPGQYYYSLRLFESREETGEKYFEKKPFLVMWFTLDAMLGELRDLRKGQHFSGNDILNLYRLFYDFFGLKKSFLCDASALEGIPLRLIDAIATNKTWYQKKITGLQLFECREFKTIANSKITQQPLKREKALRELQQLSLYELYHMLDLQDQFVLMNLYLKFIAHAEKPVTRAHLTDNSPFSHTNLQTLTVEIYNASKKSETVSPELRALNKILQCKASWLSVRVKELIEGGFFWVVPTAQTETVERPSKRIKL